MQAREVKEEYPTYRHGLRIKKYRKKNKKWRYEPELHSERRNQFRRARSSKNKCIQTTTKEFFSYHFVLPTNDPLESIQRNEKPDEEKQPESFALVINTPEATDTENARIFSIYIVDKEDLCPDITARVA